MRRITLAVLAAATLTPPAADGASISFASAVRKHHRRHHHHRRRYRPWHGPGIASWYDDSGATGCGYHASNGIATLMIPCGAKITLKHVLRVGRPGRYPTIARKIVVQRDDSGPYVSGRLFDLPPRVRDALACSDLCPVWWR